MDVGPNQPQPSGSTPIPFYGYGKINLRFNPNMAIPNGIMLPMSYDPLPGTYKEGKS